MSDTSPTPEQRAAALVDDHDAWHTSGYDNHEEPYTDVDTDALQRLIAAAIRDAVTAASSVDAVRATLRGMTADQRLEAFAGFCRHCGADNPRCQCWNDE